MAVKAPTPPTPPVLPNVDGNGPEVKIESSGSPVPAGELHTPAEKFGIHIHIGGSGAAQGNDTGEAVPAEEAEPVGRTMEQKIKSDVDAAKAKMQQMAGPQTKAQEKPPDKQKEDSESELEQQPTVPLFTSGDDEPQNLEGSVKVADQNEGFFDMSDGGTISYWPFLLVFVAAFASFLLMNFMKKRRADDDFGSFHYKRKQAVGEYARVQQEAKREAKKEASSAPVKSVKPVPQKKKKDEPPHFEIRI